MSEPLAGAIAYTDGSCKGNPGPGGWGVHIEFPDRRVIELGGAELSTTNNRMELRAAIEAARLTAESPSATIVTDSQYVKRGVTEWIAGWKRRGWLTAAGEQVANRDLWQELESIAGEHLTWQWTRGHSGDPGNERCDQIASWFAGSIQPLDGTRNTARTAPKAGIWYISVVDGIIERHATWAECESRVRGIRGAHYKKVRSASEEHDVLTGWGVKPDDFLAI